MIRKGVSLDGGGIIHDAIPFSTKILEQLLKFR